jgi:hypothetical protein
MPALNLITDEGDDPWPDLRGKEVVHLGNGAPPIGVAVLSGGMASGRPSLMLRIDLPDGQIVMAETSARLFCLAARVIQAKFPDLFDGP